jgi:Mn2+/Fe2+ NRAMP family transporter
MSDSLSAAPRSSAVEPSKPRLLRILGPGLITGASDDDPSGIATYTQTGAQFGYGITWTLLFSYPLMVAIQIVSARIGRTTGHGIAGNLRRFYPNWIVHTGILLLLAANTINLGADIGAMAEAVRVLAGGPQIAYVVAFGTICAVLQIGGRRHENNAEAEAAEAGAATSARRQRADSG